MEGNSQGDEGILMDQNSHDVGVWEPVTPAKPTPARPEFAVDASKLLQNLNATLNSKEGFEEGTNYTVTVVESGEHGRSGVNGSQFDTETSTFIEENSRNQNSGAKTGKRLDIGNMQKLIGVNANSENQSSDGIDCTNSPDSDGKDSGITDTGSGCGRCADQPQNLKKRKREKIDTSVKRRSRVKVKKHRPKIFDVMKPKKVPKSHKEKKETKTKERKETKTKKLKSEKKRKETNTKKPETAKKPKNSKKKRKKVKRSDLLESTNPSQDSYTTTTDPSSTDPQTPEPSAPNHIISSIGSCSEDRKTKTFDCCSELAPSCKRALDYDLDVGEVASPCQDFSYKITAPQCSPCQDFSDIAAPQYKVYTRRRKSDFDLNLEGEDFEFCAELKKSFRKMDFDLNLGVEDFEFCAELRKLVWEVKNFPIMSKKMRTGRRKATVYLSFLVNKKHLRAMLPTVKQFSAAIMEPKSFRCLIALQPILVSRKKRSKRLIKVAETVRGLGFNSSSNGIGETQAKCALPSSLAFPKRKRSQMRRCALPISTPDFGSNVSDFGIGIGKNLIIDLNTLPGAFESSKAICAPDFGSNVNDLGIGIGKNFQIDLNTLPGAFESTKVEPQKTQIQECLPEEKSVTTNAERGLIDLIKRLESLSVSNNCKQIVTCDQSSHGGMVSSKGRNKKKKKKPENNCKQIVMHDQGSHGALVPSIGRNKKKEKKPELPKIITDAEIIRTFKLEEDGSEKTEENYWKEQKETFCGRVKMFITCMDFIQGNRRFSRWKGSVVDSVIGVFLTQNVTDVLSSDAFMRFVAKFPKHHDTHDRDEGTGFSEELVGVGNGDEATKFSQELVRDGDEGMKFSQESVGDGNGDEGMKFSEESVRDGDGDGDEAMKFSQESVRDGDGDRGMKFSQESVEEGDRDQDGHGDGGIKFSQELVGNNIEHSCDLQVEKVVNSKRKRITSKSKSMDKEPEIQINWEDLRKEYDTMPKDTTGDTDDAVDWEAVRCARIEDVLKAVGKRGMQNVLGRIIKEFLNRLVEDHGKIDLEWLRHVPTEKVRQYLLSFERIGLKSLDCVRLLTLHHHAFPVDTNVARIVVRLGWVPLKPLPGVEIHDLNDYPLLASIQEYLWPRLSALDQPTLYELHYQMITFGKVFCTKTKPRCNVCPMKRSCKHFDSVQRCEPIIEMPASPEHSEIDIEDLSWNSKPNSEEELDLTGSNIASNQLVPLAPSALEATSSHQAPKATSIPLKSRKRLHTEHLVYVLPDDHELLVQFRKRESDDPVNYLFATWTTDKTRQIGNGQDDQTVLGTNLSCEEDDQTILGTILIPCRTANRGRFALNGTYFQVNEVFADYETSENPIRVPTKLVKGLCRAIVYCASSGRSIFRDMELWKIYDCFRNGYICVRSFDRKSREPSILHKRIHDPQDNNKKNTDDKEESKSSKEEKESKGKKKRIGNKKKNPDDKEESKSSKEEEESKGKKRIGIGSKGRKKQNKKETE